MLDIIECSLWENHEINRTVAQEDYDEMKKHALLALPASIFSELQITPELQTKWSKDIYQNIAYNANYMYVQSHLPISVPYVVLKGTSAAQYYPHPEYRSMGDIDIMTKRQDCTKACEQLIYNNWKETTNKSDKERGRHRSFTKNRFVIEIHTFFASMNDPIKAKYLDDLIVENITENHILPDIVNGLVLIDHINQHMEEGLGLRQVIDWMMFVNKCLSDDRWPEFEAFVKKTGLETLAVTTTRMCEIYLGLHEHTWCEKADINLCNQLMNYIMDCGNFGIKKDQNEKTVLSRTSQLRHPKNMLKELQKKGIKNWEAAQNPLLKHFAWVWQGIHYLQETPQLKKGYSKSKELNRMFNKLGVKRGEHGLVYYKNGKYIKMK